MPMRSRFSIVTALCIRLSSKLRCPLALLSLLALLSPAPVICIGTDGHAAVEWMGSACCWEPVMAQPENTNPYSLDTDDCGDCADVALSSFAEGARRERFATYRQQLADGATILGDAEVEPRFERSALALPAPFVSLAMVSLDSVVLRS
jgi:hypothetical protein